MKHLSLIVFIGLFVTTMKSQRTIDFGGSIGATSYFGDIGGGSGVGKPFIADIKLAKTRWNFGGFIRKKIKPKVSMRLALDYIRLEGDDKLTTNPARKYRNFNFRNDIYDVGFTFHYFFFENNDLGHTYRYRNALRLYVFGGLGGCYSNPKTLYKGTWVPLQPLATEGVKYSKYVFNIPMGGGVYFTLAKKHRLGVEINYRKTFTDYLDDISGQYPKDPGNDYMRGLILRKTELSEEVKAEDPTTYNSHDWGAKRGEIKRKDSYAVLSISYSYVIKGKTGFDRPKNTGYYNKNRKMPRTKKRY